MRNKYPSWQRVNNNLIVSEEQRDGTPDFFIERDRGKWFAKWRTSACWSGPYKTAAKAMREIEANFR